MSFDHEPFASAVGQKTRAGVHFIFRPYVHQRAVKKFSRQFWVAHTQSALSSCSVNPACWFVSENLYFCIDCVGKAFFVFWLLDHRFWSTKAHILLCSDTYLCSAYPWQFVCVPRLSDSLVCDAADYARLHRLVIFYIPFILTTEKTWQPPLLQPSPTPVRPLKMKPRRCIAFASHSTVPTWRVSKRVCDLSRSVLFTH